MTKDKSRVRKLVFIKYPTTIALGIEIKINNKKFLENNNLMFVKLNGIEEFFI